MNCIKFHKRRKHANVGGSDVLSPLCHAARAIEYCSEDNSLLMQVPPHSNRRVEPSQADSKVPDAKMLDRTQQLPRLELHNLHIRATSGLAQIIWAVDGYDFR